MSAMNDYHDLCLKVDLLLLVCVFENFGKDSINSFPSYVSSWLQLGCNAKVNDVNLKLISYTGKYQFTEIAIKGGVSMICKGYAEANEKSLKPCNTNKPTSYIIQLIFNILLDANNLYGRSIMQIFSTEILD